MIIGTVKQIWRHPVKSMAGEPLDTCTVGPLGIHGDRGWALRDETTGEITNGKRIPLLMQCSARYLEEPTEEHIPPIEITFPEGDRLRSGERDADGRLSELLEKQVSLWPREPATNRDHYRRKDVGARIVGPLSRNRMFRSLLPTLSRLPNLNRSLRDVFSREPGEPIPDISVLPPEVLEFTSPPGTYFDAFPIHLLTSASLVAMSQFNRTAIWDVRRFRPNFFIETDNGLEGLIEAQWKGRTLRISGVELKVEIGTARCGMTTHAQKELPKDPSILRSIVKEADQNMGVYASVSRSGTVAIGSPVELL